MESSERESAALMQSLTGKKIQQTEGAKVGTAVIAIVTSQNRQDDDRGRNRHVP